jgi:phospholipid transport system substrate-binding protein
MKRACARWLLPTLALAIAASAASARPQSPEEVAAQTIVEDMVDEALRVLGQKDRSKQIKRRRIEAIAQERFDFEFISTFVLARSASAMSEMQRAEFRAELAQHISATYGESLLRYSDEKVEVTRTRREANGDVTVRSRILSGGNPIPVDYRLRARGTQWYVINVKLDGHSQLHSLRNQVQSIISRQGPDDLIRTLREKNDRRAGKSAPGPLTQAGMVPHASRGEPSALEPPPGESPAHK